MKSVKLCRFLSLLEICEKQGVYGESLSKFLPKMMLRKQNSRFTSTSLRWFIFDYMKEYHDDISEI